MFGVMTVTVVEIYLNLYDEVCIYVAIIIIICRLQSNPTLTHKFKSVNNTIRINWHVIMNSSLSKMMIAAPSTSQHSFHIGQNAIGAFFHMMSRAGCGNSQ